MTQKTAPKSPLTLDPDAPFFTRLAERLEYLRHRRWVQISLVLLLLALAVWGFFYVRSLLPRTPAQRLADQSDTLQTYLNLQEAGAKLELIRAMIEAGRQPANIERYRNILADDLEATFERSPKELKVNWPNIERRLNELQTSLNEGNEEALLVLGELEAELQKLTPSAQ
jgi:hypothetical protein